MVLDEVVIISPSIEREAVRTDETGIYTIDSVYDGGNLYCIQTMDLESIVFKKRTFTTESRKVIERKYDEFFGRLKKGDKIIVVKSAHVARLIYGPINEEMLYIDERALKDFR